MPDWTKVFNIRSPYRHEADFSNTNLGPVRPPHEISRFRRIIDQDQAVSENFSRLGRKALHGALSHDPGKHSSTQFRQNTLGELKTALENLFEESPLILQDLGTSVESGTFRFQKGITSDFHYKNLSGGEKAAFDLLLDIFVKQDEYQDAIYCIDEPESHVASAIHGRLLDAILRLVPNQSQLWIATHSTGFVRRAMELSRSGGQVTFLDFSQHDFDQAVTLTPTKPNQSFFRMMYDVLQDDLAGLVAPACIVLCEGSKDTDAKIYNRIFENSYPDTLFIGRGSSTSVEKGDVIPILEAVVPTVNVLRLIDRDDMPEDSRTELISQGIRVLRRREIENFLWDRNVLGKALANVGGSEATIESILDEYPFKDPMVDDMKSNDSLQKLFEVIRKAEGLSWPGRNPREFASSHLAPALRETEDVYLELLGDIFGVGTLSLSSC